MFGRETTMPVDLAFPLRQEKFEDTADYATDLQLKLAKCHELARTHLKQATQHQKRVHDTRMMQNTYIPGQLVLKRSHRHSKLSTPWVGPYVVVRQLSDSVYLIADKKRSYAMHHDLLKPFQTDQLPKWAEKLRGSLQVPL